MYSVNLEALFLIKLCIPASFYYIIGDLVQD